jgi:hypothetical protein
MLAKLMLREADAGKAVEPQGRRQGRSKAIVAA